MVLRTERLRIRALERESDADIDVVHAIQSDPIACEFLPFLPRTREQVIARFAADVEGISRFVVELHNGTPIGDLLLFPPAEDEGREVGYEFLRSYWGFGYATEALHSMIAWAREQGVPRFTATVAAGNSASARTLDKLGFIETGRGDGELGPYISYLLTFQS